MITTSAGGMDPRHLTSAEDESRAIAAELGPKWAPAKIPSIDRTWPGARHRDDRNIHVVKKDDHYRATIRVAPVVAYGTGATPTAALAQARVRILDKRQQLDDVLQRTKP